MTWFKVDDTFHTHPKVFAIPRKDRPTAVGLWTLAGAWCAAHLTDGHLAEHMVAELGVPAKYGLILVQARLWHATVDDCVSCKEHGGLPVSAGFQFHDWWDWQPAAVEVKAARSAARSAASGDGKRGNHLRWHKRRGMFDPGCELCKEDAVDE